eukprot:gene1292-biopygen1131
MKVEIEKAREEKVTDTSTKIATGDAELVKLKRFPYCPYAEVNRFPARPDTMTDRTPKLFDLHGYKTHAILCKKSNSSMKFEKMILGPALAYFHDAIVYEEITVDLLQNLPVSECTPFLDELYLGPGGVWKKDINGLLCNCYTMIGSSRVRYKSMYVAAREHGAQEAHTSSEAPQWIARGASEDAAGARVLPYMGDFLVITKTQDDDFVQRERVDQVLARLSLVPNEEEGAFGAEADFKEGLFRVTERRLKKIHSKATALICRAARERRWVQARELVGFNGLCQSVYLAVPAARLYLRELYFVLGKKRSWGSVQGEDDKGSRGRATMVVQSTGDESVERGQNMAESDEGEASHRRLPFCVGRSAVTGQGRTELDDYRINGRWFKYAEEQWGKNSVDRFASEILLQLPRYYGDDGRTQIVYNDDDEEKVVLKEEKYLLQEALTTVEQQQQEKATPWRTTLLKHWTEALGDNKYSEAAAEMQAATLQKTTADNYERH